MKIKILHLYYDLLNMYGENGNARALIKALERQNLQVLVDFKSIEDKINVLDYDFIYIGTGSDEDYSLALNNIKKYKNDFIKYIDDGGFILASGEALNLFAEANILDFEVKKIDFRIIGEQVYYSKDIDKTIIGFQNRDSVISKCNLEHLFEVKTGTGYAPNINIEGIKKNNFYGTYLLGPLLIRNPYLLEYLVKELLKNKNIEYKKQEKDISYTAYETFLKNFVNENNQ